MTDLRKIVVKDDAKNVSTDAVIQDGAKDAAAEQRRQEAAIEEQRRLAVKAKIQRALDEIDSLKRLLDEGRDIDKDTIEAKIKALAEQAAMDKASLGKIQVGPGRWPGR